MIEDLTCPEDDDGRAPAGPAFMPGATMGPEELAVYEQMMRRSVRDFPGASEVIFTADDIDTGKEIWDPPTPPDYFDSGRHWQTLMRWPTVPTIAEAEAFQANARAACLAAWWDRLKAARALDAQQAPGSGALKQAPR